MTRADVLEMYQVQDARITSPGKFEGEPIWVPAFWPDADQADDGTCYVILMAEDHEAWPELMPETYAVVLWEDDQGFVYGVEKDPQEFQAWWGGWLGARLN